MFPKQKGHQATNIQIEQMPVILENVYRAMKGNESLYTGFHANKGDAVKTSFGAFINAWESHGKEISGLLKSNRHGNGQSSAVFDAQQPERQPQHGRRLPRDGAAPQQGYKEPHQDAYGAQERQALQQSISDQLPKAMQELSLQNEELKRRNEELLSK